MKEIIVTNILGEKYDRLLAKISSLYKEIATFMTLTFVSLLVGNAGVMPEILEIISPVFAVLTASTGLMIFNQQKDLRKVKAGFVGEQRLRDYLKVELPDVCTGYFGVPVAGHGDFDCLILTPNGVFVLDAKNHAGIISAADNDLVQRKRGRRGNKYTGDLGKQQPAAKLAARIHRFKAILSDNGIRVWLDGILVFTNASAQIQAGEVRGFKVVLLSDLKKTIMVPNGKKPPIGTTLLEKYLNGLSHKKHNDIR